MAARGGFWSYAAGVAYLFAVEFGVGSQGGSPGPFLGLELDNYKTTLPLKKGLSSSAAFCVLVARTFNQVRAGRERALGTLGQGCPLNQGGSVELSALSIATTVILGDPCSCCLQVFGLRLTTRGEMAYAYQGERLTPSQCGRMDQAWCACSSPWRWRPRQLLAACRRRAAAL